ncbi:hypothetical protein WOLCODRAFT_167627 [Wolfiporia cocos MD-104 SS10]|uniref:J domain-containing protein n=1 Tax=Wolfiporia cocos (strain MD-104) TaxID=742152 RepID=A0A2H3JLT0_WOLCO|nr:hypothetical protein WOLCODRAFT_167627 [Wolfiporia cocos MD-104 SS10]
MHIRFAASSAVKHSPRSFHTSASSRGHYHVLNVPQNATKSQIKAFELLQDVANDPKAREKFHAVSEAYAVLGDDRRRRAYDRSLTEGSGSHRTHAAYTAPNASHTHWAYETRRRQGATHAWEYARRPHPAHHRAHQGPTSTASGQTAGSTPPPNDPFSSPHVRRATDQTRAKEHFDPWASPYVRRATGRRDARSLDAGMDKVARISWFWRTTQVVAMVMIISTVTNGLSASAV